MPRAAAGQAGRERPDPRDAGDAGLHSLHGDSPPDLAELAGHHRLKLQTVEPGQRPAGHDQVRGRPPASHRRRVDRGRLDHMDGRRVEPVVVHRPSRTFASRGCSPRASGRAPRAASADLGAASQSSAAADRPAAAPGTTATSGETPTTDRAAHTTRPTAAAGGATTARGLYLKAFCGVADVRGCPRRARRQWARWRCLAPDRRSREAYRQLTVIVTLAPAVPAISTAS